MVAPVETSTDGIDLILMRYNQGREFIQSVVPGLVLLWQEHHDRGETKSTEFADLSLRLGLLLRAWSQSPADWWKISGLHDGYCHQLVGQALLTLEPPATFTENLKKLKQLTLLLGSAQLEKEQF